MAEVSSGRLGGGNTMRGQVDVSAALASEAFDAFCGASTMRQILGLYQRICSLIGVRATRLPDFYPKLRSKLTANSWRAQAVLKKIDIRANHRVYNGGKACPNTKVLIVGAGPCGLRTAIECQLLGAKVVVIEKRESMSRNNVLHLWPFVIHDLKALGAKKFFGKFCAGSIDHISIRQLQYILLKIALLIGVEFHEGISFEGILEPETSDGTEKMGWRANVIPSDHVVSHYEFDVLIRADGKRDTVEGFKRNCLRAKLAIAITTNFIYRHTEHEASVPEISGISSIFNQKFFKDFHHDTGIDLENIVYYKGDTHYFVMTAKKQSLLEKRVLIKDHTDTKSLLSKENVDQEALMSYAREAANYSTKGLLPNLEFAVNHYGLPDVAIFDFTSMFATENACKTLERGGHRLLVCLTGDSLLEPFWPTGSGCARGFLGSLDAAWAVRSWASGMHPLVVMAERESIYRLLAQTTPENLHRNIVGYTLDPATRYPNLNRTAVAPHQVTMHYDTDDLNAKSADTIKSVINMSSITQPAKKKKRDTLIEPNALLAWLRRQVNPYKLTIDNLAMAIKNGAVLCAIISRYRPDLLNFELLDRDDHITNIDISFQIFDQHFNIPKVLTGQEIMECESLYMSTVYKYLLQIYYAFKGEIPHIGPQSYDLTEFEKEYRSSKASINQALNFKSKVMKQLSNDASLKNRQRKRKSTSPKYGTGLSTDRERGIGLSSMSKNLNHDEFCKRVKSINDKFQGSSTAIHKKPKDLMRAIGKIEKTDWNVREIENKIRENKMGKSPAHGGEKVPKWNKEQFLARQSRLQKHGLERQESCEGKFKQIDNSLKNLDKILKEGSALEVGQRGNNKVANLADKFSQISKTTTDKKPFPVMKPLARSKTFTTVEYTPKCHTCKKPVYIVERVTSENKNYHKSCFRCHYCLASLRVGLCVTVDDKLYCRQHANIEVLLGRPTHPLETKISDHDFIDKGTTNVITRGVSDTSNTKLRQGSPCEVMDEDEWRDRNFGNSSFYSCSSSSSSSSEDEDDDDDEENYGKDKFHPKSNHLYNDLILTPEDSDVDYSDNSDEFSYHEYSTSEDSGSATECSEERLQREKRKQEVALKPAPPAVDDTATETETPSTDDTEKSSEAANSATEVSTDSEFAHDDPTPTRELPSICINDKFVNVVRGSKCVRTRAKFDKIKAVEKNKDRNMPITKVEIKSGIIDSSNIKKDFPKIIFENDSNNYTTVIESIQPPTTPKMSDYLLSRTQSTSGIATKRALELKKKYLLGAQSPLSIQKSDSASQLDSKFKSFHSNISECQKLLHPASDISPTMQAFLVNTSKRVAPLSPSNPALVSDIECLQYFPNIKQEVIKPDKLNLSSKNLPDVIQNTFSCFTNRTDDLKLDGFKTPINEPNAKPSNDNIGSGKTLVHDTLFSLPNCKEELKDNKEPCGTATETDMESDSLSGTSTDEESSKQSSQPIAVPRVEIHNTSGEVMQLDSLMIVNGQYIGPINSDEDCEEIQNLDKDLQKSEIVGDIPDKISKGSDNSTANSESGNDITTLALTETEMSDWAVEGAVSDNFDDVEYKISSDKSTHRLKKPKNVPKLKSPNHRKVDGLNHVEHICGKPSSIESADNKQSIALATDDFDFMDTGSEDSLIETLASVTNKVLLKNRGFMEVIDTPEPQNKSFFPLVADFSCSNDTSHILRNRETESPTNDRSINFIEQGACILENLDTDFNVNGITDNLVKDISYNCSDHITFDNDFKLPDDRLSIQNDKIVETNQSNNTVKYDNCNEISEKFNCHASTEYEYIPETVVNLSDTMKNVVDHHSSPLKSTNTKDEEVTTPDTFKNYSHFSPQSPSTAKKLLEISIDKVKQKDLIHDLVMDRLASKRLSSSEKRSSRRSRSNVREILNKSDDNPTLDNLNENKVDFTTNNNIFVPETISTVVLDPMMNSDVLNKPNSNCENKINLEEITSRSSDEKNTKFAPMKKSLISLHNSPHTKSSALDTKNVHKSSVEISAKSNTPIMFNDNQLPLVAKLNQKGEFILRPRVLSDATDHKTWKIQNLSKNQRNSSDVSHVVTEYRPLAVKDGHGCISKGRRVSSTEDVLIHKPTNELSLSDPELRSACYSKIQKPTLKDKERRKSIIQTVSSFFNKRLSPKHKEKSKADLPLIGPKKSLSECELNAGHTSKCFYKSELFTDLKRTPSHNIIRPGRSINATDAESLQLNSKFHNKIKLHEKNNIISPEHIQTCIQNNKLDEILDENSQEPLLTREEISARIEKTELCIRSLEKSISGLEERISQSSGSPNNDEKELLIEWFKQRRRLLAARRVQRDMASRIADMRLQNRHLRLRRRLRHILNGQVSNPTVQDSSISENDNTFEESAIITEIVEIKAQRESLATLRLQDKKSGSSVDVMDIERRISTGALNFKDLQKILPQ